MSCACDLSSAARLRQVELSRQHCSSREAQLCLGHKQSSVFCLVPTSREFMLFTNTSPYARTSLALPWAPPCAFWYKWMAHKWWVWRAPLLTKSILKVIYFLIYFYLEMWVVGALHGVDTSGKWQMLQEVLDEVVQPAGVRMTLWLVLWVLLLMFLSWCGQSGEVRQAGNRYQRSKQHGCSVPKTAAWGAIGVAQDRMV